MKRFFIILGLLYAALVAFVAYDYMERVGKGAMKTAAGDTVTVRDTVFYGYPVEVERKVTGQMRARVARSQLRPDAPGHSPMETADTLAAEEQAADDDADSVEVTLPVERTEYRGEGYRAWVSGFGARLDSVAVERVTERVTVRAPPRRWHLGLQGGLGYGKEGLTPFLGVGVTYSLYSF